MSMRRVVSVEQAEWGIAPPAEWVEAREPVWSFSPPESPAIAVLLFDQQHHVATRSVATRTVRRLLTANAVQSSSQVELDFDPAAHRLVIHELAVWRQDADGRWQKRSHARREAFLLRQREQQLERQILNGRLSLVALLEDVRLGDAIDLWWTLEPRDELPGLHFTDFFSFGWSVPMALLQVTLHLSPAHPVRWRMHAPPDAALPSSESTPQRATWKIVNAAPTRPPEPNAPPGDWPFAVLDVSGWTSWNEVARFLSDLWSEALAHGAEAVREEAMRLGAVFDLGLAARRTIRFVQEEIRYLALDFGQGGGILPDGAGNVLRRRFGDCKDKSVLLTALLRALGIDACPLLVAPAWRGALTRLQPSTAAFSHAIVTFTLDGKRYFADPTQIGQGGDLARLVAPPLVYGLEIRPEAESLLPLPDLPPAELTLTETFELDPLGLAGSCEQVLSASAWLANDVREALVREGQAAFFKHRTEALQRHFPASIPHADAPAIRDDFDANEIEIHAKYRLPTWGPSEAPPPDGFHYGAHGLLLAVEQIPDTEERTQPWMLRFPMKVRHRVVVRGRCVQRLEPETHRVDGTGFRYECLVRSKRHEVSFDYCWETTQRAISPSEWPSYRRNRKRAFEKTGANVMTKPPQGVAVRRQRWVWFPFAFAAISVLSHLSGLSNSTRQSPAERAAAAHASVEQQQPVDLRPALEAARRGDYASAAPILEAGESDYSDDFQYQVLRADVMQHMGRFDVARSAIDAARRLDGASAIPDGLEGNLLEAQGDLARARASLERARKRDPDSIPVLGALARVTERMGDERAALSLWQAVLARRPAQPDALLQYALLLWREGDSERADAAIVGVVESQPAENAELDAVLARYYGATGRAVEAVAPARRATDLAPEDATMAAIYTAALSLAGDTAAALDVGERATERFPKDASTWKAFAVAATQAGEGEVAMRAFRRLIDVAPFDPEARSNYGYFLHQSGRTRAAREVLEEATHRFPGYGAGWRNYSVVLAALGEASAAEEARRNADALMSRREQGSLIR